MIQSPFEPFRNISSKTVAYQRYECETRVQARFLQRHNYIDVYNKECLSIPLFHLNHENNSGSHVPVMKTVFYGEEFSGKTYFVNYLVSYLTEKFGNESVFYHFVGASAVSFSLEKMLYRLLIYLGVKVPLWPWTFELAVQVVKHALCSMTLSSVFYIIIDGVDRFNESDSCLFHMWYPKNNTGLPYSLKLIFTSSEKFSDLNGNFQLTPAWFNTDKFGNSFILSKKETCLVTLSSGLLQQCLVFMSVLPFCGMVLSELQKMLELLGNYGHPTHLEIFQELDEHPDLLFISDLQCSLHTYIAYLHPHQSTHFSQFLTDRHHVIFIDAMSSAALDPERRSDVLTKYFQKYNKLKELKTCLLDYEVIDCLYTEEFGSRLHLLWQKTGLSDYMYHHFTIMLDSLVKEEVPQNIILKRTMQFAYLLHRAGNYDLALDFIEKAVEAETNFDDRIVRAKLNALKAEVLQDVIKVKYEFIKFEQIYDLKASIDLGKNAEKLYKRIIADSSDPEKTIFYQYLLMQVNLKMAFDLHNWERCNGNSELSRIAANRQATEYTRKALETAEILWLTGKRGDAFMTFALLYHEIPELQERCYQKALKYSLNAYGEYHLLTARLYCNIGIYFEMVHKLKTALKYFKGFHRIALKVFGKNHPKTMSAESILEEPLYKRLQRRLDRISNGDPECPNEIPDLVEAVRTFTHIHFRDDIIHMIEDEETDTMIK